MGYQAAVSTPAFQAILHNRYNSQHCLFHNRIALYFSSQLCERCTALHGLTSSQMAMVTTSASVMGELKISHKETLTKAGDDIHNVNAFAPGLITKKLQHEKHSLIFVHPILVNISSLQVKYVNDF